MPGDDDAAVVCGALHNDVTSCLMVYFEASTLQCLDHLAGCDSGQAGHYAGPRATLT